MLYSSLGLQVTYTRLSGLSISRDLNMSLFLGQNAGRIKSVVLKSMTKSLRICITCPRILITLLYNLVNAPPKSSDSNYLLIVPDTRNPNCLSPYELHGGFTGIKVESPCRNG